MLEIANLKKDKLLPRELRDENSLLKRTIKNLVVAMLLPQHPVLQGITRASLQTNHLFLLHLSKKLLKY
jgi:DNA-directed RNA polymerase subunit beta'